MQFLCTFVVWITVQTISATNTPIIIITPMEKNGEWYTTQAKCSYNLDQTYNQLQIKVAIVTNCQVLQCSLNVSKNGRIVVIIFTKQIMIERHS